jgi:phosphopantothenoylcysteine decarboxylase
MDFPQENERPMSRIVLGVTGSVAAVRTPALHTTLVSRHHQVRVVATEPALYFFEPADIVPESVFDDPSGPHGPLYRDQDEWPASRYRRDDPVLHIEFRKWADMLVVAPLDANTLAKFALGFCDNFLTCLFRAWDFSKPVILAPHGRTSSVPPDWSLETAAEHFAELAPNLILIPPQSKRLACGDVGVGAMAEVTTIAEAVRAWSDSAMASESS